MGLCYCVNDCDQRVQTGKFTPIGVARFEGARYFIDANDSVLVVCTFYDKSCGSEAVLVRTITDGNN